MDDVPVELQVDDVPVELQMDDIPVELQVDDVPVELQVDDVPVKLQEEFFGSRAQLFSEELVQIERPKRILGEDAPLMLWA